MKASTIPTRRRQRPPTKQADPLTLVRDNEARSLVVDLDNVFDNLMGRALQGDHEAFAFAQVVKVASDHIAAQRLNNTR
jgi:hypothetical protein